MPHNASLVHLQFSVNSLTLFRMGLIGAAHGWEAKKKKTLPKMCHTYPIMMKLGTLIPYLKKFQKPYKSHDVQLEFCCRQHFLPKISQFCYIMLYQFYTGVAKGL